jgi:hypothetical protein
MQTTNTESVKPASISLVEVKKYDSGKPMVQLVESWFILEIAKVMTFGAKKYGENNWKGVGGDPMRTYGSTMRHLLAYHGGKIDDPESGLPHLAHAATEIMFTMYYEKKLGRGGELYHPLLRDFNPERDLGGENIITRPPMHGTENLATELLNRASALAKDMRESAHAAGEKEADRGEGEEQKQTYTEEEECSCERWMRATERVAKRIGVTGLWMNRYLSSPNHPLVIGGHRYTQAELRELIEKEEKREDDPFVKQLLMPLKL